jgi:Helicase conserved C-terminal domain
VLPDLEADAPKYPRNASPVLRNWDARPPAKRDVSEDPFSFETNEEREVYDAVTHYIDRRFDELEEQQPGKGFVMTIYRRRAASSPVALRKSMERRAVGLKAVIAQRAYDDTLLDVEDAQELEDLLSIKLTSALPSSPEEAANELYQVERLLEQIDGLGGLDTKRDRLVSWVKRLTADGRSVLVFTSYSDTMEYLRDALAGAIGAAVASYSGDGGAVRANGQWSSASKENVTAALRAGKVRVLVCTDAASEGLNLQAAGALVNFDLPWNPSKVEQRIGRVDRIGQELPILPIVNLYLKDSIDQRVYRALNARCGLFETFVGPMQPVLSRALRMLMRRDEFDEDALARVAEEIKADPTLMQAFPEDDPAEFTVESVLAAPADIGALLAAFDGTGIYVIAETNARHRIQGSTLQLVTAASAVAGHPDASTLDGLDPRQWALLRQLQRPGERLPLCIAEAEDGGFRVINCSWVDSRGTATIHSFTELKSLVAEWDGTEPPLTTWNNTRLGLERRAAATVQEMRERASKVEVEMRQQQLEAARLRLIDELGRMLICYEPNTDDLNGKLYRLASEPTPTATRLRRVLERLEGYPDWAVQQIAALREFRARLNGFQLKARLTGRELDAALDDPRWAFAAAN